LTSLWLNPGETAPIAHQEQIQRVSYFLFAAFGRAPVDSEGKQEAQALLQVAMLER
jgi:hypothetical protein